MVALPYWCIWKSPYGMVLRAGFLVIKFHIFTLGGSHMDEFFQYLGSYVAKILKDADAACGAYSMYALLLS